MSSALGVVLERRFRADVEGLRAVAVIAVVAFHYGVAGLTGGFVGVDVFFVISGYLITRLLLEEAVDTGRIDLLRFYGRRFRRLLPAALLVIAATLVAGFFVFVPLDQERASMAATSAALYVSNLWYMRQAFDYFAPETALSPFLHTWSLAVEEQFYIAWPIVILILSKAQKTRPAALAIGLLVLTALSFLLCLGLTFTKQPWAFYLTPARAWEFGIGGLAALPSVGAAIASRKSISNVLGWGGMLLLVASLVLINEEYAFPGLVATLPVLATAVILLSGATDSHVSRILGTAPLVHFGRLSYSIYLWHWPVIVFAKAGFPDIGWAGIAACAILSYVLALTSYTLIENPVRKSQWLAAQKRRSIGLGAILTASSAAIGATSLAIAMLLGNSVGQQTIDTATNQSGLASRTNAECLSDLTTSEVFTCDFGAPDAKVRVVLIGDSHAEQWSSALAQLATDRNWKLTTILKSSCAMADIPVYNNRLRRMVPECAAWRQKALERLEQLHPDMVLVSQFSSGYVEGNITDMGDHAVSHDRWRVGLRETLGSLSVLGIPIVLLRDNPTPNFDIRRCLLQADWFGRPISSCNVLRVNAVDQQITEIERQVAEGLPNVHFLDLTHEFCAESICPASMAAVPVYRDRNHLGDQFSLKLSQTLGEAIDPFLPIRK